MADNSNSGREEPLKLLINQVHSETTKHYIVTRLLPQMTYYSNTSRKYKKRYTRWMIAAIILGAMIPVLSVLTDGTPQMKVILSALGSAVTAINAYLALENSKDLWRSYRQEREILLSTLYCYFNNAGMFTHLNSQEEKDTLLIEICEKEMTKEVGNWAAILKSQS